MGYRFELRKFTYDSLVKTGGQLKISALWANVGVAPIYNPYPLVVRLTGQDQTYTRAERILGAPDEDIVWEEGFGLPGNMSEGEYQLEIGIETGVKEIGNIQLAIEGNKDGYYPMGKLTVERGDKEMESLLKFNECIAICNFDYLPEGLEAKYDRYKPDGKPILSRGSSCPESLSSIKFLNLSANGSFMGLRR